MDHCQDIRITITGKGRKILSQDTERDTAMDNTVRTRSEKSIPVVGSRLTTFEPSNCSKQYMLLKLIQAYWRCKDRYYLLQLKKNTAEKNEEKKVLRSETVRKKKQCQSLWYSSSLLKVQRHHQHGQQTTNRRRCVS